MPVTEIWFQNWRVLIRCDSLCHVWPASDMDRNAKLNATVRLSVLVAVLLRVCGMSWLVLCVPLGMLLATVAAHRYYVQYPEGSDAKETFSVFGDAIRTQTMPPRPSGVPEALHREYPPSPYAGVSSIGAPRHPAPVTPYPPTGSECRVSTYTNPFGNPNVTELQRVLAPACSRQDTPFRTDNVHRNFEITLNKSVDDGYNNHASQRQYFTMPWTQGFPDPNNDFPSWLYDTPPILKEQAMYQAPV